MLIFLKVALQIVTVVSAIVSSTLDYKWHDKRTTKFKTGRVFLFTLTGVLLVLSIGVTVIDDYQSGKREQSMTSDLKKVQAQNDGLQNGIRVLGDKSADLLQKQEEGLVSLLNDQRRLNDETGGKIEAASNLLQSNIKQTVTQQKQTLSNLTGGNSFCYVVPMVMENNVRFQLNSIGEFPLYDINVLVENLDTDEKSTYQAPTISAMFGKELGELSLESLSEKNLLVTLRTRYAIFSEDIRMVRVNNEWLTAWRVRKSAVIEHYSTISGTQERPRLSPPPQERPRLPPPPPRISNEIIPENDLANLRALSGMFDELAIFVPTAASEPQYLLIRIEYDFPRNKNGYVDW